MTPTVLGALILAVPALLVAALVLWRQSRAVFAFAAALILVGTGYLMSTGATADIALRLAPSLVASQPGPAPAPAR